MFKDGNKADAAVAFRRFDAPHRALEAWCENRLPRRSIGDHRGVKGGG